MYVVVRFKVDDDKADLVERALSDKCDQVLRRYTNVVLEESGTAYERAGQRAQVYSTHQTQAATAYLEVVEEIAQESEGDDNLAEEAVEGLLADVKAHPDFEFA